MPSLEARLQALERIEGEAGALPLVLPDEAPESELERLRARVEDQELLFRLRVLGLRLRELRDQPIRSESENGLKG